VKDGVATMPTAVRLPESGRLLGIVCDALRLTLPPNRKANGRRYLAGERALPDEARVAVVRAWSRMPSSLGTSATSRAPRPARSEIGGSSW
jgi:hypothetical protein